MTNKLILLIGPSGTGKDAIKKKSGLPYIVSHRTRVKRPGEVEGQDGFFITEEEFLSLPDDYWIAQTTYSGSYYGASYSELEKLKKDNLLYVIDWEGYLDLKSKVNQENLVTIFIDSNINEIDKRMVLQKRKQNEIDKRMQAVEKDLQAKPLCQHIISNKGSIKEAVDQLFNIIDSLNTKE